MSDEEESLPKIDINVINLYDAMNSRIVGFLQIRNNDIVSMYASKLIESLQKENKELKELNCTAKKNQRRTIELRHKNCKNPDCKICWDDHMALKDKLEALTGNNKIDHLDKYRYFLSQNKINAETEWGWASEESFDDKNISDYVKDFRICEANKKIVESKARLNFIQNSSGEMFIPLENSQNRGED